jgi:hypothetical protein
MLFQPRPAIYVKRLSCLCDAEPAVITGIGTTMKTPVLRIEPPGLLAQSPGIFLLPKIPLDVNKIVVHIGVVPHRNPAPAELVESLQVLDVSARLIADDIAERPMLSLPMPMSCSRSTRLAKRCGDC